jgi:integrase
MRRRAEALLIDLDNPTTNEVKQALEIAANQDSKEREISIKQHIEDFIEHKSPTVSKGRVNGYNQTFNHLQNFMGPRGQVKEIDGTTLSRFRDYLYTKTKSQHDSNINKHFRIMKVFLKWAVETGRATNTDYQKFKLVPEADKPIIALTFEEVETLEGLDLKDTPYLERVRDVFCFACRTGQRYGDISRINWQQIDLSKSMWYVQQEKGKKPVEVPLSSQALAILKKYEGQPKPLPVITNQKYNDYLKDLGKKAELSRHIYISEYNNQKATETYKPIADLLTTHIARKTFITVSLDLGMRPEVVMAISGHSDHKVFYKRYVAISAKAKQADLQNAWDRKAKPYMVAS